MATLRELRKQAKDLEISYEKDTTAEVLQELIAEKMCLLELEKEIAIPPAEVFTPEEPALVIPPSRSPITEPEPSTPAPVETASRGESTFASDIEINEDDLNNEFKTQASKFDFYARAEAMAKAKAMSAKARLEVVDAEMTKKIRERLALEGTKPTEKMIQSEVILSDEYQAAQRALIDANQVADIARGAKDAFVQRRDMLIQIGVSKRQIADQIGMNIKERVKEVLGTKSAREIAA